ncbi:hypothetical protein CBR_g17953 [Chara braunii]|uniref:Uncharacterized protein n=1 Tax=Chara braunii TaxID=69332 RepID=A0A388KWB4_CHABU|nr:hypothetical protein CBR_g17953 [Chara braunii]|eukprot:GBG74243.1 hypothetical protein CBR_g17953 [Chara braunii]
METPGVEGSGRSPPAAPQMERDYWEDEDRIRELLAMRFDDGIYPTDLYPGEMVMEGREVRFKLNTSLDDIKVKWLKERTVTVIYKDAARFLTKNVKDDLVRAFEDGWIIGNENLTENSRRGRVKIEGPGVASYVAKAREIPLDDMSFIYAQIEKAIGKIVLAHPADADPNRPSLVNARFNLDPEARQNMKDVLWIETAKGDTLEVRLATSETPKCGKCRQFFHTENECRRGGGQRNQGIAGAMSNNQMQNLQQGQVVSGQGGGQNSRGYQGVMRPRQGTPAPSGAASHDEATRMNPVFSPRGGNSPRMGQMVVPVMGNPAMGSLLGNQSQAPTGAGPSNLLYGMPPLQGMGLQGNWWQGGTFPTDWLMASGYNPTLWPGMMMGSQGGQGGMGLGGLGGQPGDSEIQQQGIPTTSIPGAAGSSAAGRDANKPSPSGRGNSMGGGGEEDKKKELENTPGRSRGRGVGKQRRLSLTSLPEVTPEHSRSSRISREDSGNSVSQELAAVTPGNKTTRGRRLASSREQGSEMAQYLLPLLCTFDRNSYRVIAWQKDAIAELKIRLPKDKRLDSNFVKTALTQGWPAGEDSRSQIQSRQGSGHRND